MHHHRSTTTTQQPQLFLLLTTLLLLLLLLLPCSPQPSIEPLRDAFGRNVTTGNVYYIRNHTAGSPRLGAGTTLYRLPVSGDPCYMFVGLAPDALDPGVAMWLIHDREDRVIWPKQRFRIAFTVEVPCRRLPEWGLWRDLGPAYVITGGMWATRSWFRVTVDASGLYTLEFCGPCAGCTDVCKPLGISADGLLMDRKRAKYAFNVFFEETVPAELNLHDNAANPLNLGMNPHLPSI